MTVENSIHDGPQQDSPVGSEGDDKLAELEQRFTKVEKNSSDAAAKAATSELMSQLLADPDFAAVFNAKNAGRKIKVVDEATAAVAAPQPEPELAEGETDPKKISEYVVKKTAKSVLETVNQHLAPLKQRLESLDNQVSQDAVAKAKTEIGELRKTYSDFEEHTPSMRQINAEMGGKLPAKELYILAKVRAGQPINRKTDTDTERPSSPGIRHPTRKTPVPPGRVGVQSILDSALKNLDLKDLEDQT